MSGYFDAALLEDTTTTISRSGRKIKSRPVCEPPVKRVKAELTAAEAEEREDEDYNRPLCLACNELHAEDGSDLLLCEGPCLGSW